MQDSLFEFRIRKVRIGDYNRELSSLAKEVEIDFEEAFMRSNFLVSAPFKRIYLYVAFSDRDSGPKIAFVDREHMQVNVDSEIDWSAHVSDDRPTLKNFIVAKVFESLCMVTQKFEVSLKPLLVELERLRVCTVLPVESVVIEKPMLTNTLSFSNELEFCIRLSNDQYGTEEERKQWQEFVTSLESDEAEFSGTLCGEGYYFLGLYVENPRDFYAEIESELDKRNFPKGSRVVGKYLNGLYSERDVLAEY